VATFRVRSAPESVKFLRNWWNLYRFSLPEIEPVPYRVASAKKPLRSAAWHLKII
jgi:hypothetical protein